MGTILHLSDLHLGDPGEHQYLDDHKSGLGFGDRRTESDVLRETLLDLRDQGVFKDLSAAVISGDLTNKSSQSGFDAFAELIAPVVDSVGKENVLVVPGNHDVPWDPGPGAPDRYKGFLSATREHGFVTPLLDAEDFDASGEATRTLTLEQHLLRGNDYVIVPLNSSHFCWGQEPLSDVAAEALLTAGKDVQAVVDDLRRHDVARISNAQLRALTSLVRGELVPVDAGDRRVRIAVLHHQLLPVSPNEELKTFEGLSNLGAVRELFAALGVRVVLHGHKHESALFWDYVVDRHDLNQTPHRMVVAASPAVFRPGAAIGRLLHIQPDADARDVVIEELVASESRGGSPTRGRRQRARLWRTLRVDQVTDSIVLTGASVASVYGQLRSVFADRTPDQPLRDLTCEIRISDDAGLVPPGYPNPDGVDDVQAWMTDLVEWWQLAEPQLLQQVTFNHGERIYRHWKDQVQRAIATLRSASGTTRAMIMLFDPWTDGEPEGEFPSFVLVQLQVVERERRRELDCTAYFRKQEMRYWWPINVAELAKVRAAILKGLTGEHAADPGRLVTVTGYAAAEERLPTVALAAIDRAVDQRPEDLWRMAHGLVTPTADRDAVARLWDRYLGELEPSDDEPSGRLPLSYRGLKDIGRMLGWLGAGDEPVAQALNNLVGLYSALLGQRRTVLADAATTLQVRSALQQLRSALDARVAELEGKSS